MARTVGSEGARTEAAIREAAVGLIARHGFEAVSMRRLAEAVGVTPGALYRYFPTKQALLHAMMRAHMRSLIACWRAEAPPRSAPPAARLEAFARFHVRYHIVRRDEVFINYMELRSLAPENAPEIKALRREYEAELRAILKDGVAVGAFAAPDLAVTAMALIAMLTGVTTWRKEGGRLSPAEIEQAYAALALAAVGAAPGAANRPPAESPVAAPATLRQS
jgi:AcrR family transcriptional regulator